MKMRSYNVWKHFLLTGVEQLLGTHRRIDDTLSHPVFQIPLKCPFVISLPAQIPERALPMKLLPTIDLHLVWAKPFPHFPFNRIHSARD